MSTDSLILVDKHSLYDKILLLISDHRSDVLMEYHEKEAKEIVEELTHASF